MFLLASFSGGVRLLTVVLGHCDYMAAVHAQAVMACALIQLPESCGLSSLYRCFPLFSNRVRALYSQKCIGEFESFVPSPQRNFRQILSRLPDTEYEKSPHTSTATSSLLQKQSPKRLTPTPQFQGPRVERILVPQGSQQQFHHQPHSTLSVPTPWIF